MSASPRSQRATSPAGALHLASDWPSTSRINRSWLADETRHVTELLDDYALSTAQREAIQTQAMRLVEAVRDNREDKGGLDAFLHEYDLSSEEGIVLMCLAEALLRIPDADTADRLIADKLASGHWEEHLGTSESLFVNASTWGLMLTGRLMRPSSETMKNPTRMMKQLATRAGEPVLRTAMRQAMRIMGHQFVMGRDIREAMKRGQSKDNRQWRYSFDMLGEAALTDEDADRYFEAYAQAIDATGAGADKAVDMAARPSVSVKLSALYPRYEYLHADAALEALGARLLTLAQCARDAGIALTMDAEEADRLELSLRIFERVYRDDSLKGWGGLGLAVQAYQKRARDVVGWLAELSAEVGETIFVRLVKGAYWDTEIKRAQEQGLSGYPVFTRKVCTDLSYLVCARDLLNAPATVYPQFATHNAHTVASILQLAGTRAFEFQRLHGMGEELYAEVARLPKAPACRVYAPVGRHKDLLPYLVRRLLENGANTSFVNRIVDEQAPIADIVADPVTQLRALKTIEHPRIGLPGEMFAPARRNSSGMNLADPAVLAQLSADMHTRTPVRAQPLVDGRARAGAGQPSVNPAKLTETVGEVIHADAAMAGEAVAVAQAAWPRWDAQGGLARAGMLRRAAELYETHCAELMSLCLREAGKTVRDALAEVREAVDFLRYYAWQAEQGFAKPELLPGPTGERNELSLHGRGVFVCISPWNFPLAIFTGQVSAALVAGNAVIAKPAEQTPLVAARAVALLHEAGIPPQALQLLPGEGSVVGAALVADPRISGVAFTGSTVTAQHINRSLAARDGSIATLIAETGGQNAMLVDSSALPEQVVLDVVQSAFGSAGQRCSALRVLYLQQDIAGHVLKLLAGAMRRLVIGDPADVRTDVGPVIDEAAREMLEAHIARISAQGTLIHRCELPQACAAGSFVAPAAVEIDSIARLEREVFGPVLHVVRYRARDLDRVIDDINATGFGLTLGIHSRVDATARHIAARVRVGNTYINRNQIGAVVGVQPFGGQGLSGTGPKAGGPHYLARFANERVVTVNTAAVGGNASLLAMAED
ncbi:MAG: bifunctional proline dehydrogenase/L-glutamate gamma-semialdehyde dehydrogenase PutA [Gammaproteobacteria bacterium]|nr:bifunctional proline dehydrogenase/L-glutamate gamma-semialdehyde dehydrogenase PutA [Gammaproteobacteria bacterium]